MEQEHTYETYLQDAQKMFNQGYDNVTIEKQLEQTGANNLIISGIMQEIKRIRNAKRTKIGSLLALIGVLILGCGFIGCIIIHLNNGDVSFSLYGLTALGAIILVGGLIYIFS